MNNIDQIFCDDSDLDEGTVQMYERRLRNGRALPAVVMRDNNGRFEVIDGFHRIAAMQRCGIKEIKGVYLVNIPTEGVPQLRRQLNRHSSDCNGMDCDCASKRFTDFFRNRHNGPEEEIGGDDSEALPPIGPWVFANPPYRNKKLSPTAVPDLAANMVDPSRLPPSVANEAKESVIQQVLKSKAFRCPFCGSTDYEGEIFPDMTGFQCKCLDCGEQFYAEASITFKDVRIRKDEQ